MSTDKLVDMEVPKRRNSKKVADVTVVKNMRNYSKDAVVKKHAAMAIAFLDKYGVPDFFTNKNPN